MESRNQRVTGKLEEFGWKARIVSVRHLPEIQSELAQLRKDHPDVERSVGRYIDKFDSGEEIDKSKNGSVLIVAIPQPMARAWFTLNGVQKPAILPPTYLMNTSVENEDSHPRIGEVNQKLNLVLAEEGASATKINLPGKLMAVKSGLGKYGRNNICYIDGDSSFYWIGVYVTDLSCKDDPWGDETVMEACEGCECCATACPGNAIAEDRFVVHADHCLTLYNESSTPFPDWIGSDWHNTAIGCMECQWNCPVNRSSLKRIEDIAYFDENETGAILSGTAFPDLQESTQQKLANWNYAEDYELLPRNLTALFSNDIVTCAEMKKIEARAAASGISYSQMMENAGQAAANVIMERESVYGKPVLILCGKGNNGGDGFVVARRLKEAGAESVILLPDGEPTGEESLRNKQICEDLGVKMVRTLEEAMPHLKEHTFKLIVDGLYGTGFHGQLTSQIRTITQWINNADAPVYSLDIPSGLTGDDGVAAEDTIRADVTIVFHRKKPVHCEEKAAPYLGEVVRVPIGI
jgi:epoxyqueuosine reductase